MIVDVGTTGKVRNLLGEDFAAIVVHCPYGPARGHGVPVTVHIFPRYPDDPVGPMPECPVNLNLPAMPPVGHFTPSGL